MRLIAKNDMFINENEWLYLAAHLCMGDFKVYIVPKMYKRFFNKVSKLRFRSVPVLKLDEHPLLRKDSENAHSGKAGPSSRQSSSVPV